MNGFNLTLYSVLTVTEMVIYSQCVNEWCQPYLRQCTDSYRGGNTVNMLMNGVCLTLDSVLTVTEMSSGGELNFSRRDFRSAISFNLSSDGKCLATHFMTNRTLSMMGVQLSW